MYEVYQDKLTRIGEIHGTLRITGVFSKYRRTQEFYVSCACRPKLEQVMLYAAILKQGMCDTCFNNRKIPKEIKYVEKKPKRAKAPPYTVYNPKRGINYSLDCLKEYLIKLYSKRASDRNLEFSISDDYFLYLITQPCHYCGKLPDKIKQHKGGEFLHHGIDRVHNHIGYIYLNCVPCCWECNRFKGSMSYDEFVSYLERVTRYRTKLL